MSMNFINLFVMYKRMWQHAVTERKKNMVLLFFQYNRILSNL